ncbi:uncharacterized protein BDR25DRAFT_307268 [Lindgomyces ingoldianus]|uniref:Uncharacterized protein n=1 Tax=Lindgomyces ingoldianus TaxID=673940 RepID=A0ACB6QB42_9PLEO|nr:uncharacterized protein BDR25DRAFT_307268 [Lindgomyces ingoldianus]KAF2464249.1 hypothetical protein BDR25DRAFT_307268 [Lindgomyces ingoldianus]
MCRRRHQQQHLDYGYTTQSTNQHPRNCHRSSKRNYESIQHFSDNYYRPLPPLPISISTSNPHQSHQPRHPRRCRRKGPCASMAALIIAGIGIGATKIQEKREKKKAKKAALVWEEEQSFEEARRGVLKDARTVKEGERRKCEEAGLDARGQREGSEPPPPSYEDAVQGVRNLGAGRSG